MSNKAQHWKEELLRVHNAIAQEREDVLPLSSGKYAHLFTDGSIFLDRGDEAYPDLATCRAALSRFNEEKPTIEEDYDWLTVEGTLREDAQRSYIDLPLMLTEMTDEQGNPFFVQTSDSNDERCRNAFIEYREELAKRLGEQVRVRARIGRFREERLIPKEEIYWVEVDYLASPKLISRT
jgi:hypothetical protein